MNRKFTNISKFEDYTKLRTYKLYRASDIDKKTHLWTKMRDESVVMIQNLKFLDEGPYLLIPFPFKQQTKKTWI